MNKFKMYAKGKYVSLRFKFFNGFLKKIIKSKTIAKTEIGRKFISWYAMKSLDMIADTLKLKIARGDKK